MDAPMKNIAKAEVLRLADQVEYQDGQIVSKTLAQNDAVSLTLFAFEKGEEISTHAAGGPCWRAPAVLPSTASPMCSPRARALSCLSTFPTPYTGKSASKCC